MAPQVVQYPRATSLTTHSSRTTGVEGAGGSGGRKRAWLRCPRAVAGPGWASRRRITTQHRRRRRCGGRRRDRRAQEGPGCGARGRWRGLAGQRADAPSHASATRRRRCGGRRRVRRAQEGLAAVPVGGGGAWPGFETTRRAKLAARTARGRAAAHGRTKQPGPTAGSDGARNTSGATSTTERRSLRTPRSTPGSGRPGGRRGARAR